MTENCVVVSFALSLPLSAFPQTLADSICMECRARLAMPLPKVVPSPIPGQEAGPYSLSGVQGQHPFGPQPCPSMSRRVSGGSPFCRRPFSWVLTSTLGPEPDPTTLCPLSSPVGRSGVSSSWGLDLLLPLLVHTAPLRALSSSPWGWAGL